MIHPNMPTTTLETALAELKTEVAKTQPADGAIRTIASLDVALIHNATKAAVSKTTKFKDALKIADLVLDGNSPTHQLLSHHARVEAHLNDETSKRKRLLNAFVAVFAVILTAGLLKAQAEGEDISFNPVGIPPAVMLAAWAIFLRQITKNVENKRFGNIREKWNCLEPSIEAKEFSKMLDQKKKATSSESTIERAKDFFAENAPAIMAPAQSTVQNRVAELRKNPYASPSNS